MNNDKQPQFIVDYQTTPIEISSIDFQENSTYTLLSSRKSGK